VRLGNRRPKSKVAGGGNGGGRGRGGWGGQTLPKMMLVRATRLLMPSLSGPGPLPATAKR